MLGIHCPNFDLTLSRIAANGGELLTDPLGDCGQRRVCLRDPDGIVLELMEDYPMGRKPVTDGAPQDAPSIAFVTVSVRDLNAVGEYFVDVLGLNEIRGCRLHEEAHELLWGLSGATRSNLLIDAGDILVELVEYAEPAGRPKPAGYLISDHGILNVAFGSTSRDVFLAAYDRSVQHGFLGHTEPWTLPGIASVVYVQGPEGLSVELLHVEPNALGYMGFPAS